MTKREWNYEAFRIVLMMKKDLDSPYRRVREHARYVRHFFFGDGEMDFLNNEVWISRRESKHLPMSYTEYFIG